MYFARLFRQRTKGVGSTDTLQILLHIHIPYPIHVLCRPAVQDGSFFDQPIVVFSHGALLRIDQMASLILDDLCAVLHLVNSYSPSILS